MSGRRLERRYRRLLLAYPPAWRAAHGEELLGTVLEAAAPGQRLPAAREATGLLLGGLRTRARQAATASPPRLWRDGLHLGVLLVVLANLGQAVALGWSPWWIVLVAVGVLAVLRGWARTGLAATALAALVAARPLLPPVELPWWLPGYGDWSAVARYALPAAVLAALAWPGDARLRPRSWWWLLLPAAQVALPPLEGAWAVAKAGLEAGIVVGVLLVAVAAVDPRPALAVVVYLAPGLVQAAEELSAGVAGPSRLAFWAVVGLLAVVGAVVAVRTGRAQGVPR